MRLIVFTIGVLLSLHLSAQNGINDLSTQLSSGKTYGAYCGIAGKHPPARIKAEKLIIKGDIAELTSWLSSPNLVIQTYAAEGIIRLHNDGQTISEEVVNLVLQIKAKEDLISTCKGCFYEELSIRECLVDFKFNDF